jgi:hypothetical protein
MVSEVLIQLETDRYSDPAIPRFTISTKWSYHSDGISLIHLHTLATYLIAATFSTSHGN